MPTYVHPPGTGGAYVLDHGKKNKVITSKSEI
jgi:hypothetical protein